MEVTPDSKYCFLNDTKIGLLQIDLESKSLKKYYPKIFSNSIQCIAISPDSGCMFVGGRDSYQVKWNFKYEFLDRTIRQYEKSGVMFLKITKQGDYLFSISNTNMQKQFSILDGVVIKDFKQVCTGIPRALCITHDGKYVFIASSNKELKQLDVLKQKFLRDWDSRALTSIYSMEVSKDGQTLVIGYKNGKLKLLNIRRQIIVKDYGIIHRAGEITSLCIV